MTGFEIVSIVGALAWLPPIVSLIRNIFIKSIIQINTSKTAEIGFSTFGQIVNLRLAFSAENKDIVLSSIIIRLKHETGEEKVFSWQGIVQNLGRLTNPGIGSLPYEKENAVLAIKLNTREVDERFIRFQNDEYLETRQMLLEKIRNKIVFLTNTGTFNPETIAATQEFDELSRFNQQSFSWKTGKYRIILESKSRRSFKIINNEFSFNLDPIQIETLQKNIEYNKIFYMEELKNGLQGNAKIEIQWNWVNPILKSNMSV